MKRTSLYTLIHIYYASWYFMGLFMVLLIVDHFGVNIDDVIIKFIVSHSLLEMLLYSFGSLYLVSLPHTLIVLWKEMKAISKKQLFQDLKAIEKREKEIREYANLFNDGYYKTGDVNESIKHVWRTKKPM